MGNLSHVNAKLKLLNMGSKPVLDQIRDAIAQAGLPVPDVIRIDGEVHRFKTGKKNKDGWYCFHNGEVVWGAFGCNRQFTDAQFNFQQDMGRDLTPEEQLSIERSKVNAQKKRADEKREAANKARETWGNSNPAPPDHPYLSKKRLGETNLRIDHDHALIIPYYDDQLNIAALEKIYPNGDKRSHGSRKGLFGFCGELKSGERADLCEGFADAATIHQETGAASVFSGGAGNLVHAACTLKTVHPDIIFTIVSDNDSNGVGQEAAAKASDETGWHVIMPTDVDQDISDVFVNGGDVRALLMPDERKPMARTLDELLKDTAPTRWLVKNWVPRASLGMLHGPSAGGKSFLTVDLAMSIAVGKSHWQGCKVKRGHVLCLSGEGQGGFVRRLQAWCQQHEVTSGDLSVYDKPLDLDTPQGLAELCAEIDAMAEPPACIFIDTLHCYYQGDENSSKDARAMINNLKAVIARYGCAIVVVHHTGLGEGAQQRARGSSAWRGALDFEINLQPGKDDEPIKVQHLKSKDGQLMPSFYVTIEQVPLRHRFDEDGEQEYSAIMQPADKPMPAVPKETPMQRLEAAWWWAGAQWKDGLPVIDKKQLIEFLHTQRDMTEQSAKDHLKPSRPRSMLSKLLRDELIIVGTHKISIKCDNICAKLKLKSCAQID